MFVGGFVLLPHTLFGTLARVIVAAGGIVSAAAAYVFVYNIRRTIDGVPPRQRATTNPPDTATLPVLRRASSR
jgi:hypothetical protein